MATKWITSSGTPTIYYYLNYSVSSTAITFYITPYGYDETSWFGTGYGLRLMARGGWTNSLAVDTTLKSTSTSWKASEWSGTLDGRSQMGPQCGPYTIPTNGYSGSQSFVMTITRTDSTSSSSTGTISSVSTSVTIPSSYSDTYTDNPYQDTYSDYPSSSYVYYCYTTGGSQISGPTSFSTSSITRPSLSGYTYVGYVYHSTLSNALNQGLGGNYDGTTTSCSQHSSNLPYVVFFYQQNASSSYYWGAYDRTNGIWIEQNSMSSTTKTRPNYSGYTFVGWGTGNSWSNALGYGVEQTSTTGQASSSWPYLVFYYDIAQFTVTINYYDYESGSYLGVKTVTANSGETVTIYNHTAGSVASGSYQYYEYSGSPNNTSLTKTSTSTVTWYYSRKYTLTVNANGGTYSGTTPVTLQYAQTTTVSNPTRSGYVFRGWTKSGGGTLSGTTYTFSGSDCTLTANWAQAYTITYNANGGSGTVPSSQTFYSDSKNVTIPTNTLTKTNYNFLGWSTSNTASTASYIGGNTYTMSTQNYTLYAVWQPIMKTITYNNGGGSGGPGTETIQQGSTYTVNTTNHPTKADYIFKGWANGSGMFAPTYKKNQSYTLTVNNDTTLYAVWWPQFEWNLKDYSEGNTLNNLITTYIAATGNGALTKGTIYKIAWYNNIANLVNKIAISSGRIIKEEDFENLAQGYRDY